MLNLLNSTMLNWFITKWGSFQSLLQNGATVLQIKGKYQKAGQLLQSKAAKQFWYAKFFSLFKPCTEIIKHDRYQLKKNQNVLLYFTFFVKSWKDKNW